MSQRLFDEKVMDKIFYSNAIKWISNNFKMRTDTLTGTLVETKRLPWQPFSFCFMLGLMGPTYQLRPIGSINLP
ncbi:hypothetical protein [Paenibacillus polymyxa]|uniref:hypothetical protein n=1 Tax=Paenibacillus polymyxa TaxID=1406 RepID=UPI002023DD81|nr:hypothetical protein [Paenibacillus polymyxa]URJ61333.1 hypothetical protein MF622_001035 [Paenibacillus polymyxa]